MEYDLSSFSGKEIKIRFHSKSKEPGPGEGWAIDNIRIHTSPSWLSSSYKTGDLIAGKSIAVPLLIDTENLQNKSYEDVALEIIFPFVKENFTKSDLQNILNESYANFRHEKKAPIKELQTNKYILELIYGPTFAFKDYALQFLGKLFSNSLVVNPRKITVLGATSGDTGSAAIHAFKTNQDINVFILHPHGKVSPMQQKQMTTVDEENIFNIEKGQQLQIESRLFPNPWSLSHVRWHQDSTTCYFLYNQRGHQVLRLIAVDSDTGQTDTVFNEHSPSFIDYSQKMYLNWFRFSSLLLFEKEIVHCEV